MNRTRSVRENWKHAYSVFRSLRAINPATCARMTHLILGEHWAAVFGRLVA